jgi:hypothetical protein
MVVNGALEPGGACLTVVSVRPSVAQSKRPKAETICDVKTLSPHDSSGYFSIADTDSIKPIDKLARKVHSEYAKACDTPEGSKGPIETFI